MDDLVFGFGSGKYELRCEPDNEDGIYILDRLEADDDSDDVDECLGMWNDVDSMLMDIDYGEVGNEITLEDWQRVWDWAHSFKRP